MNQKNEPGSILLTSKTIHDIRNNLNTILGYAEILQDIESLSDEQKRMQASVENAALNIRSLLSTKKEVVATSNDYKEQQIKQELKVLIVDDYEDNRTILELLLKKFSLKIFHAHNGKQSVKVASEQKPDLIFMDLHMPDINGIEASKLIKDVLPDVKIIALSGDIDAIENEALHSNIFESYVSKPFNREEIKNIVKKFIATQSEISQNNKPSNEPSVTTQFANQKILIIDDKLENLSLFKDILTPYNYEINVATSGIEALKTVNSFQPELILLDVVMPHMNGYEVLKELKQNKLTNEIPVIFLTANDTTDDIVNGFEAGVVDYIAKPFHPRELIARVDTHLKKAKLFANLKKLMEHSFHELYTPLSIVNSAMQMQELEYEKTNYTQMTLAASKTLQSIYDDLYYSINYSNVAKNKTLFDFTTLLRERIHYFSLVAQSRSLTFQTDLEDEVLVQLNKEELERVIDNLISNALKYTQETQTITVSTQRNNGMWIFSICNPVSKTIDVEKIFQKYFRHEEEVFGLGLGLELVQSICKKNNIDIRATADENLFCIKMELPQLT